MATRSRTRARALQDELIAALESRSAARVEKVLDNPLSNLTADQVLESAVLLCRGRWTQREKTLFAMLFARGATPAVGAVILCTCAPLPGHAVPVLRGLFELAAMDVEELCAYGPAGKDEANGMLHICAAEGGEDVMEELLRERNGRAPDVNSKDSYGRTPLLFAVTRGRAKMVQLLLRQKGVDVNVRSKHGLAAIDVAVQVNTECHEIVELLAKAGAQLDRPSPQSAYYPLHCACINNYVRSADALLRHGATADVLVEDDDLFHGMTPLHLAAQVGVELVKTLVSRGANVDKQDRRNNNVNLLI